MSMMSAASGWVSRSHRAIAPFALVRPQTVAEALDAYDGSAAYLAGGIDQINRMQDRAAPQRLIDLGGIRGLGQIAEVGEALNIGAGVTHHRIETAPELARFAPELAAAWATVGNIRVRMAGTVGGNVMARHPNYDAPVLFAACNARYVFENPDGTTLIVDPDGDGKQPDPAPGALLTRIVVPTGARRRLAFDRSLKPVVSVAAAIEGEADGRVAVGCAHVAPWCATFDADGDVASRAPDIAATLTEKMPEPFGDTVASAAYRRRAARALIARLIVRLAERAG